MAVSRRRARHRMVVPRPRRRRAQHGARERPGLRARLGVAGCGEHPRQPRAAVRASCGTEIPREERRLRTDVRYRSFFSGHATLSFTGAGLSAPTTSGSGLLGTAGDILTLRRRLHVATMTSLFRVMSDMHYASDAVIGALVGHAAGSLSRSSTSGRRASEPTRVRSTCGSGPWVRASASWGSF